MSSELAKPVIRGSEEWLPKQTPKAAEEITFFMVRVTFPMKVQNLSPEPDPVSLQSSNKPSPNPSAPPQRAGRDQRWNQKDLQWYGTSIPTPRCTVNPSVGNLKLYPAPHDELLKKESIIWAHKKPGLWNLNLNLIGVCRSHAALSCRND